MLQRWKDGPLPPALSGRARATCIHDPDHNLRVRSDAPMGLVTNSIVNAGYEITAVQLDSLIDPLGAITFA